MLLKAKGGINLSDEITKVETKNIEKKEKKKGKGCLTIIAIVVLLSVVSGLWNMRPIRNIDDAVVRVFGKKNVLKTDYYQALETIPSRLTSQVVIRPILSEEDYKRQFAKKATELCKIVSELNLVDEIVIGGYIEAYDGKGNEKLSRYCIFTSTKEDRKDVNWKNFSDLIIGDFKLLNEIGKIEY